MIRRAYVAKMRLWADSNEETEVRWFRCVPEATTLAVPTPFGSSDWLNPRKPYHLGEVLRLRGAPIKDRTQEWAKRKPYYTARGRYDKGQNALHYSGRAVCGELAAFQFGGVHGGAPPIQTDSYGYSPCCQILLPTRPVAWCDGFNWRARVTHGKAVVAAWCEGIAWSAHVEGTRCPSIQTELLEDIVCEDGDTLQIECPPPCPPVLTEGGEDILTEDEDTVQVECSSPGPPVTTLCCPSMPISRALTLTVSGANESYLNGTFALDYDEGSQSWHSASFRTCADLDTGAWVLSCHPDYDPSNFDLTFVGEEGAGLCNGTNTAHLDCSMPFALAGVGLLAGGCICITDAPDATWTVTG